MPTMGNVALAGAAGFPGQLWPAFSVGVTVKISFSCAYFLRLIMASLVPAE
jgi:hypothetical protein